MAKPNTSAAREADPQSGTTSTCVGRFDDSCRARRLLSASSTTFPSAGNFAPLDCGGCWSDSRAFLAGLEAGVKCFRFPGERLGARPAKSARGREIVELNGGKS